MKDAAPLGNAGSDNQELADIVAIIPARGGSKGIPKKNIQLLCGKPLVGYSIEAALRAKRISRVIVSTDDEEIADIARRFGAEVPFLRPKFLAEDCSGVDDVVSHLLHHLEQTGCPQPLAYANLYPTHPFRPPELIDACCDKILQGYDRVVTVRQIVVGRQTFFRSREGRMAPLANGGGSLSMPQRSYFRPYGLVEVLRVTPGDNPCFFHVIRDPLGLIDIDLPEDLAHAQALLQASLVPFFQNVPDA